MRFTAGNAGRCWKMEAHGQEPNQINRFLKNPLFKKIENKAWCMLKKAVVLH